MLTYFKRGKNWIRPLSAGLLALLIVSAVFAVYGVTPFGHHNLLISDMGGQYLSFFTAYRHALLTHNFQLYFFSQSLGGNTVPLLAYYLLSPFNLLILLFPAAKIPTGLSVIIIIKVAAIALTGTFFLQRHYRSHSWATALFGTAYSLCGFVAGNYFTIMWLDALIWLPLIILGLEHLIERGRPAMFFWWLWLSIVTNYYLGYMTCLFVCYYFVYLLFEMKAPGTSFWQALKMQARLIRRALLTGLLSGLSSLFLLVPTMLAMLKTAKSAVSIGNYLPVPQLGLSTFSQLGVGGIHYLTRLHHAPTLFVTTLVVLLVLSFFQHPQIRRAHKWHVAGLLMALLLTMAIRTLDTAWHMFQRPAGFPYREAFFLSFVMVMIAFETWQAGIDAVARKWQSAVALLLAGLLLAGWVAQRLAGTPQRLRTLAFGLAFILVTSLILTLTRGRLRGGLLTVTVALELAVNLSLTMVGSPLGDQTAYQRTYQLEDRQMRAFNDPSGQLYRVENQNTLINAAFNYDSRYRNYNDPLLFNFHDITYYSSTFNDQTRRTLKALGLYSRNVRRISSEGLNTVSAMLLGVKYNVTLNTLGEADTRTVRSYNGMGFAVPDALTAVKLSSNNVLANQERLLQALQPRSAGYFQAASVVSQKTTTDHAAQRYPYRHRVWLRVRQTGPLYYDDPHGSSKYTTMTVNGQRVPSKFNANGGVVIRNLGHFTRGDMVVLTVKTTRRSLLPGVQIASLNAAAFTRLHQSLTASAFYPRYYGAGLHTVVSGTMTNATNQRWGYVAIPADSGWRVTVNGTNVTKRVRTVLGGMQAVPLRPGKNQLKLVYHVPGAGLGWSVSLLSLAIFSGCTWYWRRDQRR
ncbi:YfhO family protein [Lactiplantibacillus plajomi]|nr:YfhO family protein [Lactiplantibacillus plajomi]